MRLVPGREAHCEATRTLRSEGWMVIDRPLHTSVGAIALCEPDLILIDAAAQLMPALAVCKDITRLVRVPVVIRVAGTSEALEVMCLAAGARVVIPVSASARLAVARIRAARVDAAIERDLVVGPLIWRRSAQHLLCDGRGVVLSRTEGSLVEALMERPRHIIERDTLIRRAWEDPCSDRALESALSRLRTKVFDAGGPRIAVPVRGLGYRLGLDAAPRR